MNDIDVNLDDLDIESEELSADESAHMESIVVETPVKKERKSRAKKNFSELHEKLEDSILGSPVVMGTGQPVEMPSQHEHFLTHVARLPLARLMQVRQELKSILPDSHAEEGYTYVSLSKVIRTVTDVAYTHGFAIVETLIDNTVAAHLWDIEGEREITRSSEQLMPRSAYAKIQDRGAEITYARRYVYMSLMGITVDRDNDGKIAKPNTTVLAPKGSVDNTVRRDNGIPDGAPVGVSVTSPQILTAEIVPHVLPGKIEKVETTVHLELPQPKTPEEKQLSLLEQLRFQWDAMKAANKTHLMTESNIKVIEAVLSGAREPLNDRTMSATCAHIAAKMAGK